MEIVDNNIMTSVTNDIINWDGSRRPNKINLELDTELAQWLRSKLLTQSIHSANAKSKQDVDNCNKIILQIYRKIGDW